MMRKGLIGIALVSVAIAGEVKSPLIVEKGIYQTILSQNKNELKNGLKGEVIKIIDGKTLLVNIKGNPVKVRIFGIKTPEVYYNWELENQAKKCNTDEWFINYLGKQSEYALAELLKSNKEVVIKPIYEISYDEVEAIVETEDGEDLGQELIEEGYACPNKEEIKNPAILYQYNQAMKIAKIKGVGLWQYDKFMKCFCELTEK
jgi:micrococcal nuclease